MATDRWDPFHEILSLREAMDRFMRDGVFRPTSAFIQAARGSFPIDVQETTDGYTLRASLPGVRPEDVQVQVEGNILTIRAERKAAQDESQQGQWLVREHRDESFARSVTLPATINVANAQARYEHGILLLQLPKAETAPPQRIPIAGVAASNKQEESMPNAQATPPQPDAGDVQEASDIRRKPSIDEVMEASEDSFPASDPPSYTQTAPSPTIQSSD